MKNTLRLTLLCAGLLFALVSLTSPDEPSSVKIGEQVWTNANLSVTHFRNGDEIPESKSKEDWLKAGYREEPTWCYYKFDEQYSHLGKLYNYYAVSSDKNLAPSGWKVPSFFDFKELIQYLDPLMTDSLFFSWKPSYTGGSLISKHSDLWKGSQCPQIDAHFNALPVGRYYPILDYPEFDWDELGDVAGFWCRTNWTRLAEKCSEEDRLHILREIDSGDLVEKAIVGRIHKGCRIDFDEDPKLTGWSVRLLQEQ
ncbi:MAG: FISUMP domain-containing protein [Flavobacteriales bacterium]